MSGFAVVSLVKPEPNAELIAQIEHLLEQAKSGEIAGVVAVAFRADNSFAVKCSGHVSNLQMAGALAFAQYDIIVSNAPKADG